MPSSDLIAFQGSLGAYSDLSCRHVFPDRKTLPCATFEDVFAAVHDGRAQYGMLPIENSVAGRVADNHSLLPHGGLHIIGEHYQRVNHHLLAPKGATLDTIKTVRSHIQALSQCRKLTRSLGLREVARADTAGAAAEIAERGDITEAAIASELAGEIYGLVSLKQGIEDAEHNTTRFLVLSREPRHPGPHDGPVVTTFTFRVRNRPAALYKALGGFATNGVNMVKLESYVDGAFTQAEFYADIMGHPQHENVRLAFEELRFFSHNVEILGIYPADRFRERVG